MTELCEFLPSADDSDLIRQCWGDVPRFQYANIFHVKPGPISDSEQTILLTAFFMTHGPEDANQCKPSRMVIEFSGIVHWEYDSDYRGVEARLDPVFQSPPSGSIALYIDSNYIVCRKVRILSCVRDPFTDSP